VFLVAGGSSASPLTLVQASEHGKPPCDIFPLPQKLLKQSGTEHSGINPIQGAEDFHRRRRREGSASRGGGVSRLHFLSPARGYTPAALDAARTEIGGFFLVAAILRPHLKGQCYH